MFFIRTISKGVLGEIVCCFRSVRELSESDIRAALLIFLDSKYDRASKMAIHSAENIEKYFEILKVAECTLVVE